MKKPRRRSSKRFSRTGHSNQKKSALQSLPKPTQRSAWGFTKAVLYYSFCTRKFLFQNLKTSIPRNFIHTYFSVPCHRRKTSSTTQKPPLTHPSSPNAPPYQPPSSLPSSPPHLPPDVTQTGKLMKFLVFIVYALFMT